MAKEEEKFQISRNPNFCKLYGTNIICGSTDVDFRIEILNEKFENEEGEIFISDALIMLTPQAAKKLNKQLTEEIAKFEEKLGGEIEVSKERERI
jgi:hypothetical protein